MIVIIEDLVSTRNLIALLFACLYVLFFCVIKCFFMFLIYKHLTGNLNPWRTGLTCIN